MSRFQVQPQDLQIEVKKTQENLWSTPEKSSMLSEFHGMDHLRSQFNVLFRVFLSGHAETPIVDPMMGISPYPDKNPLNSTLKWDRMCSIAWNSLNIGLFSGVDPQMSRFQVQPQDLQIEVKTTQENLWSTPGKSPMLSDFHAMDHIRLASMQCETQSAVGSLILPTANAAWANWWCWDDASSRWEIARTLSSHCHDDTLCVF